MILNNDLAKWQVLGSQDQVIYRWHRNKIKSTISSCLLYEIYAHPILNQIELQATNLGANTKIFDYAIGRCGL